MESAWNLMWTGVGYVNIVIETHLLTIMGSPETNQEIINEIGSKNMSVVMDYVNHFQSLEQVFGLQIRQP